jgi:sugar phosphate isomerase/epimerase
MNETATMTTSRRSAHDLGPDDLVWDHFSRPRTEDIAPRVYAAAAAGYSAIGVFLGSWAQLRANPSQLDAVDEALDATGLCVANIETLRGWAVPGANEALAAQEALAYDMADHWGCRYVQIIGDAEGPLDRAAEGFAALCDRASDHGLAVGLEWVPSMTNIQDAPTALQIVLDADRPNGGLCVDSWHFTRSTNRLDDLRAIPGEKVVATQWNDGTVAAQNPNYYEDTLANRVVPGEGEFALEEILRILDTAGSQAPIGMEVCSAELWAAPIDVAAQRAADAMRALMNRVRGSART